MLPKSYSLELIPSYTLPDQGHVPLADPAGSDPDSLVLRVLRGSL